MSSCSIHPNTPDEWIASMRDSLARTLASLENRQELLKEPGQGFTGKSCGLLAVLDQGTSSWKMWPLLSAKALKKYSKTWPKWGMTQGGSAFVHPMSERRITVTGGSHWPTPRANIAMASTITQENSWNENRFPNLETMVGRMIWPTPRAMDGKGSANPNSAMGCLNRGFPPNLPEAVQLSTVKMWPTPKAGMSGMSAKTTGRDVTKSTHLTTQVVLAEGLINVATGKMWPTPQASEYKDTGPAGSKSHTHMLDRSYLCATVKDPHQPTGQLNPTWVEWLMGFPTGFTASKDWVTPKSRSRRQQPLKSSTVDDLPEWLK
jgi:hypothetical protein